MTDREETRAGLLRSVLDETTSFSDALRRIGGVKCPLCGPDADDDQSQWCGRYEHGDCCAEYAGAVLAMFGEP